MMNIAVLFVTAESFYAYLWLFAVLSLGSADDVPYDSGTMGNDRSGQNHPGMGSTSCWVPPQPTNGRWKLHQLFCDNGQACDIPQGLSLAVGTHLVYSCDHGFKVTGNVDVYCTAKGTWSAIPSCVQIKCESLNSASRITTCYRSDKAVDCDSSVLPGTRAQVFCRSGYRKDTTFLLAQGETVTCKENGKWDPDPIRCETACGVPVFNQKPLDMIHIGSFQVQTFPWHAVISAKSKTEDPRAGKYLGGATLIRANLLLTAAHCVYNEETKTAQDPRDLVVRTGHNYRIFGWPKPNPEFAKESEVKDVYIHCNYVGSMGNYASDIALIELEQPLVLSRIMVPACLDVPGYSEQILEPGAVGRVSGVERSLDGGYDIVLDTEAVPYISYSQCKSLIEGSRFKGVISNDIFCAGRLNESTVCDGDSGGGLVVEKYDRWFVVGIHSATHSVGRGHRISKTCPIYTNSLYTKVSAYMPWILNVIYNLEHHGSHPSCNSDVSTDKDTTTESTGRPTEMPMTNISTAEFSCSVPPQPDNGEWMLHGHLCGNNTHCTIPQYTTLKPGSKLVYSCAPGYGASGNTDVYCDETGEWSAIPVCIEVKCDSLNSASTIASCSRDNKRVSCDSPVPLGTRAEVSCHPGYKRDALFTATRRETVTCTENGKWQPDPIRCVPVCGVAVTHQTPNSIGGSAATINDFPWHASLFIQRKTSNETRKTFTCGATIIHPNFVLTAAHCIYNEGTKTTQDPKKLFVITGNIFRDYDYAGHNSEIVRKAMVKDVYRHSTYYGLLGNYASDIALIELQQPFEFSRILLPACLDVDGYSEQILEPGAYGKVCGFGRTSTGSTSTILQTLTVPYVSYTECKSSKNAENTDFFISNDKFCAGYTNGTSVCDGDSGGGLVFKRNDLWYIMGIVSSSLGIDLSSGQPTCDKYSYTLYTKVSIYMSWIHEIISNPGRYKST